MIKLLKFGLNRTPRKKPSQPEYYQQVCLFRWAALKRNEHPDLEFLYASANGGKRNKVVGGKLKASGVKAGVPDINLPFRRGEFAGLWIEMKAGDNKPTDEQNKWIQKLREEGHRVEVCYGWQEAADIIEEYLKLPKVRAL